MNLSQLFPPLPPELTASGWETGKGALGKFVINEPGITDALRKVTESYASINLGVVHTAASRAESEGLRGVLSALATLDRSVKDCHAAIKHLIDVTTFFVPQLEQNLLTKQTATYMHELRRVAERFEMDLEKFSARAVRVVGG